MVSGETFTAIDIGSSRIKVIIGIFNEKKELRVLGVGVSASNGVRKGNILDMDEFKRNLDAALGDAEKMTGESIASAYLVLSGTVIDMVTSSAAVTVMDQDVNDSDIARVLDMTQSSVDLTNRTVLKVIPETFGLDNQRGIKNPVGMSAKKLDVKAHIFTITTNSLNNIKKAIVDVGVEVVDTYPAVISAGEAVLSRRQKELGVVAVDIGASSTSIAVYEEGSLVFASIIPIGGEHVTSDIALGARVSIDLAEKVKIEYADIGFSKDDEAKDEDIDLSKLSKSETGTLSKKFLSEIVRARYGEMMHMINTELRRVGRDGMLPEGVVLTGGGSKVRGVLDMARDILRLPAAIGVPEESDFVSGTSIGDPVFASVIGTLILSQRYHVPKSGFRMNFSPSSFLKSCKNLFGKILP